jgi:hypothetical protein
MAITWELESYTLGPRAISVTIKEIEDSVDTGYSCTAKVNKDHPSLKAVLKTKLRRQIKAHRAEASANVPYATAIEAMNWGDFENFINS